MSKEQSDQILRRHKEGESLYDLAREFNRHPSNVYTLLKRRYGYATKGNAYWPPTIDIPDNPAVHGYLAGLIDGEGSLKRRKDGLWSVGVQMTDESVIRWLHTLGGSFGIYLRDSTRKTIYCWKIARRHDVLGFLRPVEPHMIVKRVQAQAAISELEERVAGRPLRSVEHLATFELREVRHWTSPTYS